MDDNCTCTKRKDDEGTWRTWVRECPQHGEDAILARLLPVGTRIYNVRHPELTGTIKSHEWKSRDEISAIPYLIEWDDGDAALRMLGLLWIYADLESVAKLDEHPADMLARGGASDAEISEAHKHYATELAGNKVVGIAELNDEIAAEQASDRSIRLGGPVPVANATALDTLERLDHNLSDFQEDNEP